MKQLRHSTFYLQKIKLLLILIKGCSRWAWNTRSFRAQRIYRGSGTNRWTRTPRCKGKINKSFTSKLFVIIPFFDNCVREELLFRFSVGFDWNPWSSRCWGKARTFSKFGQNFTDVTCVTSTNKEIYSFFKIQLFTSNSEV